MPRHSHVARRLGLVVAAGMLLLTACSDSEADAPATSSEGWQVAAAFYPLQFVTERVGGDQVSVTNLTKPGAEPHDLELAPQDLATLSDADLTVYLSGFQPAIDDAIATSATGPTLDVASDADLSLTTTDGATDPHFWLDPLRLADVADAVAVQLSELDPAAEQTFEANAASLRNDLEKLDSAFSKGLADCRSRLLVTSHTAFAYLADAYDLEQVGLTGVTPETEPNPQELAEITDVVNENDVTTIFYETLVSPDVADTVAQATGASTAVLDPLEGITDESAGDDYLAVMGSNLAGLDSGLGCS